MVQTLTRIRDNTTFQNFITGVILLAGIVVGLETYPHLVDAYGTQLHLANEIILWIFVAEIVVKMGAEGSKPWRYFYDAWNVFDFVIVAACFMPGAGSAAAVLRLARLLRVLKLVNALPKLQILVGALLKSIPSMFYVTILLGLLFYVYACACVFFWGANDPVHFESLQLALLSLFRVVTLEDWTDIMYIAMYGCANYGYGGIEHLCTQSASHPVGGALFFSSFVLLGTMIILNLFIGVIMNGMDEAQAEAAALNAGGDKSLADELAELQQQLEQMNKKVGALGVRAKEQPSAK